MADCGIMLWSGRKSTEAGTASVISPYRRGLDAAYVHRQRSNILVIDDGLANLKDDELLPMQ